MTEWVMKRFWTSADVTAAEDGFAVTLDGQSVKTPGRATLVLPTEALARLLAEEWNAQGEKVDPKTMPMTRLANSAIDTVAANFDAVADMIAAYGETDLLCYRADSPQELVARQDAAWAPYLDWIAGRYGARLKVTAGVLPVEQDAETVQALSRAVRGRSAFALAGLHELVTLTGSLVLGLAAADGAEPAETLWTASRIDEEWQISQWGRDDEAEAAAARKLQGFMEAKRFVEALGNSPSPQA